MDLLLAILFAVFTPTQKAPAALPTSAIARADFLNGCWKSDKRSPIDMRERWVRASPTLMTGTSWIVHATLNEYTYLRIEASDPSDAADLTLVSQPAGQMPARLALDRASNDELAFVKEAPGSVGRTYRRGKDDTITIRISVEGARPLDIPMKKTDCR